MSYSDVDDFGRVPGSLSVVHCDSERRVYLYRDSDGQLWESSPGDTDGTLHPVDDVRAYFRSEQPASPKSPPSSAGPMTHFPDTWDPPANYEFEDLPSSKRIAAKIGNYRRTMFGGVSRTKSGLSQSSEKSTENMSVPEKRGSGVWSSVSSSLTSVTGSIGGLSKRSSGWSST